MKEITLKLTIDEANLILESLGQMKFVKVFALVEKIQQQAAVQLGSNGRQQKAKVVESIEEEKD